jgi:DNA recombination protein RmuC
VNAGLWPILTFAFALAFGVTAGLLLRRRPAPAPAGPDPALTLLQQQVSDLGGRLSELSTRLVEASAAVPRDVGAQMNALLGQMGARLAENAQAVQKIGSDTGRLIADLNVRLGELGKSSQQILALGQDVRGLQQIFQAPKTRGALGEMSLNALLEQSFPSEHVRLQHGFKSGDRVDALLQLPGGAVSIDSKFPLAAFRKRLEATGEDDRRAAARAFAREVRKHVDDIASKYIRPVEGTLDFALMYIPAESVFYDIVVRASEADEDINDYALKQRVIPVSPNSLYAYLQAIGFGLMGLRIEQRAREILNGLQQVGGDLGQFREGFDLGQRHLRNAQGAFAEAAERLARLQAQVDQFSRSVAIAPAADSPAQPEAAPREVPRLRDAGPSLFQ